VVRDDRTVALRPVTVGEQEAGRASIQDGLSPGEVVVVDGAERLREGLKVEMKGESGSKRLLSPPPTPPTPPKGG
jgi:multidrug efflux system membrane fusion protein